MYKRQHQSWAKPDSALEETKTENHVEQGVLRGERASYDLASVSSGV